jgi:hypothetical protein
VVQDGEVVDRVESTGLGGLAVPVPRLGEVASTDIDQPEVVHGVGLTGLRGVSKPEFGLDLVFLLPDQQYPEAVPHVGLLALGGFAEPGFGLLALVPLLE